MSVPHFHSIFSMKMQNIGDTGGTGFAGSQGGPSACPGTEHLCQDDDGAEVLLGQTGVMDDLTSFVCSLMK